MDYYKYLIIRELSAAENVEETLVKLASSAVIGRQAARAVEDDEYGNAAELSRWAASEAIDVLGRAQ